MRHEYARDCVLFCSVGYIAMPRLFVRKSKDYVYGIWVYKYLVYEKVIIE